MTNPTAPSTFNPDSARFGHISEDSALVVDDYPYGFRLRTSIRYWIETTKHGDRFVSQTLNPKTDRWNKPKKSTYAPVMAMYLDDKEYVTHTSVQQHSSDEWIARFTSVAGPHLNVTQRSSLARVVAMKRVFERVTFTITTGPTTDEQRAAQIDTERRIGRAIARETRSADRELGQSIGSAS